MGDNVRNTRSVCCRQTDYINVNDYKASMLAFIQCLFLLSILDNFEKIKK